MLYDKPRSFSWHVRPSFSSAVKPKKVKKRENVKQSNDNLISATVKSSKQLPPVPAPVKSEDIDIILKGKPTFTEELMVSEDTIIDISELPVIDGIPMLILPEEPAPQKKSYTKEAEQLFTVNVEEIRSKEYEKIQPTDTQSETTPENTPVDEDVPMLQLTDDVDITIEDTDFEQKQETLTENTENKKTKLIKKEKVKKAKKEKVKKEKKEKLPGRKTNLMKIAAFFVVMYIGTVLAFIIPLRPTYSDSEKRKLTQFPEFSTDSLANGEYFSEISTWFSDTFPFREQLLELNSFIKNFYGIEGISIHGNMDQGDDIPDIPSETPESVVPPTTQPPKMPTDDELKENNGDPSAQKPDYNAQQLGAIIVAGDSAYEYYAFSQKLAPRFISAVDKIPEQTNADNVYALINPTSIDIKLNDALRADVKSANQEKALNYFNGSLKKTIAVDTLYQAQREHKDEYTYFRSDHHWTALGAYYSYKEFCDKKGFTPTPLSTYETKTFEDFKGTFYASSQQNNKLAEKPDSVTTYTPFNNVDMTVYRAEGRSFKWPVINDVSNYNANSKYSTFIAGDNALTIIKNNDNPHGKSCVVIKDSYGNAFVPFLIPHYGTIYVIDPRHYEKSLEEFSKDKEISDVLFICNISVTRNDVFISALENLLR